MQQEKGLHEEVPVGVLAHRLWRSVRFLEYWQRTLTYALPLRCAWVCGLAAPRSGARILLCLILAAAESNEAP